ncbi:MAG TPA: heme lyase NrfEFG subunit NrfE, partial [Acidiferrobacteraceae bacterium]|nr:heme lyase NrfEFG subunit NrfE [Acidiferrobacteraceae bacterium]HEX20459.1 heme lyase NrfEFG subunit NrfE [Acidiferrobacteraceae bacterium]
MTSHFSTQKDLRMQPEEHWTLGGYRFVFKGARDVFGPNFDATEGVFWVYSGDKKIAVLNPQKRVYGPRGADRQRKGMDMTEAAIDPGLFRDLYIAMGEPLQGGAWGISLYYKPFVRWIWLGSIFMALGGLLAAGDRRYRVSLRKRQAVTSDAATLTSAT